MTPKLKEKIKRTLSNYEIDLTDTDLKKLIKEINSMKRKKKYATTISDMVSKG